jgi:hypothetical protein
MVKNKMATIQKLDKFVRFSNGQPPLDRLYIKKYFPFCLKLSSLADNVFEWSG